MDAKLISKKLKEFKKFIAYFTKNALCSVDDIHTLRIRCRELFSLLNKNEPLAKKIKKAISLTNGIRDIDVFFEGYLNSLPKKYRRKLDIKSLEARNNKERKKELKKALKYLKNLKIPKEAIPKDSTLSVEELAVMELSEFEQAALHKYRIHIKKRLYREKNSTKRDEEKIAFLTNIKDILGDINDNYNAIERLKNYGVKEPLYDKIAKYTQKRNQKLYENLLYMVK